MTRGTQSMAIPAVQRAPRYVGTINGLRVPEAGVWRHERAAVQGAYDWAATREDVYGKAPTVGSIRVWIGYEDRP